MCFFLSHMKQMKRLESEVKGPMTVVGKLWAADVEEIILIVSNA